MPQLENGYTKLANELLEAFAKVRIPGEARQVLDVIMRKTYGFNKLSDAIALSQFMTATGLKKVAVCKAIKKLLDLNIITKKGNAIAVEYSINKHYRNWKPLPKKVTLPKKVINVTEKGNKPLPKKYTTKDTIQKIKDKDSSTEINSVKPTRSISLVDDDLLVKLEQNEAYAGINIRREYGKMLAWIETPRGRGKQPTKARFINWLNRATPEDKKNNTGDPMDEIRERYKYNT